MPESPDRPRGRALVAGHKRVATDPRAIKQVEWLQSEGWIVDTLSPGAGLPGLSGTHHAMATRPLPARVAAHLLLPSAMKHRYLVDGAFPAGFRDAISTGPRYDLIVLNDPNIVPWFAQHRAEVVRPGGRVHLDLHEYSLSQRTDRTFRLVFGRYWGWLTGFIPADSIDSRSVVSPGIADLYVERYGIERPLVVRNIADRVEQEPGLVDAEDIKLVYHGGAARVRGLDTLITAMASIEPRFSLHLMLVGDPRAITDLRTAAAALGDRVVFHDPVDIRSVARALNAFDLEVIFFPPVTENLRYVLPNKLFEAIQARLGIVLGASPDMVRVVEQYGNGAVVDGWTPEDLARTINALDAAQVSRLKAGSHAAAADLSSETEKAHFLAAIGLVEP